MNELETRLVTYIERVEARIMTHIDNEMNLLMDVLQKRLDRMDSDIKSLRSWQIEIADNKTRAAAISKRLIGGN